MKTSGMGKPFTVAMNGIKVEVGKTLVKDVTTKGYKITASTTRGMPESVPKKTYTSTLCSFYKDNNIYSDFGVINSTGDSAPIESCKIKSITFNYGGKYTMGKKIDTYEDATINGFNPKGMTKSEVKAKIKDKITKETDTQINIENGNYHCWYFFDKTGKVSMVDVGVINPNKIY